MSICPPLLPQIPGSMRAALLLSLALQALALALCLPFGSGGGRRDEKGREEASHPHDVARVGVRVRDLWTTRSSGQERLSGLLPFISFGAPWATLGHLSGVTGRGSGQRGRGRQAWALPLLGFFSQGERGETGPSGPAGFAGPPVSSPVHPSPTLSAQASRYLAPEGTFQLSGTAFQTLKMREMASPFSHSRFPHPPNNS